METTSTCLSTNSDSVCKNDIDKQEACKNRRPFLSVYPLVQTDNVDQLLSSLCMFDDYPPNQGKDNDGSDAKDNADNDASDAKEDKAANSGLSFKFHNNSTELYSISLNGYPVAEQLNIPLSEQNNSTHQIQPSAVQICDNEKNQVNCDRPLINFTKTVDKRQDRQIIEALSQETGKDVMIYGNDHKITTDHLLILWPKSGKLSHKNWFTCDIIDFYFWALNEREIRRKKSKSRCHFFPVYFLEFLKRDGSYNYKETADNYTHNIDIFGFDKLFIVINKNQSHWACMVVYPQNHTIVIHDSMNLYFYRCGQQ